MLNSISSIQPVLSKVITIVFTVIQDLGPLHFLLSTESNSIDMLRMEKNVKAYGVSCQNLCSCHVVDSNYLISKCKS